MKTFVSILGWSLLLALLLSVVVLKLADPVDVHLLTRLLGLNDVLVYGLGLVALWLVIAGIGGLSFFARRRLAGHQGPPAELIARDN